MRRKTLLAAALLLFTIPALATDIFVSLTGYYCTPGLPGLATQTAQWTGAPLHPSCTKADTTSGEGTPRYNTCSGSFLVEDLTLPHGMCHWVRTWAPELNTSVDPTCSYFTSQEFYVYSEYNY